MRRAVGGAEGTGVEPSLRRKSLISLQAGLWDPVGVIWSAFTAARCSPPSGATRACRLPSPGCWRPVPGTPPALLVGDADSRFTRWRIQGPRSTSCHPPSHCCRPTVERVVGGHVAHRNAQEVVHLAGHPIDLKDLRDRGDGVGEGVAPVAAVLVCADPPNRIARRQRRDPPGWLREPHT